MMGIECKVAKVLNSRELVFNKGASDGVETGMKFNIQGIVAVVDPDSNEELGSIMRPKLAVEVVEVEPRFSIARTFETFQAFSPASAVAGLLSQALVARPIKIRTGPSNDIREDSVFVSVGDPVIEIVR